MAFRSIISFRRDGTKVLVLVDPLLPAVAAHFVLTLDRVSEIDASLLFQRLDSTMDRLVTAAREEAYAAGYKDGRGKRAKQDWQPARLGRDLG